MLGMQIGGKLTFISTVYRTETPLSHSKMLTTRRRKNRGKKILARTAKREKKLGSQNAKTAGASAPKEAALS